MQEPEGRMSMPGPVDGVAGQPWRAFRRRGRLALGLGVLLAWVYNGSGGSFGLAILMHLTFNTTISLAVGLGWTTLAAYFAIAPWLFLLYAAAVVAIWGPARLARALPPAAAPAAAPAPPTAPDLTHRRAA
jgi:hypothetical protein